MERRNFLQSGLASAAVTALSPLLDVQELLGEQIPQSSKSSPGGLALLSKPYDSEAALSVYEKVSPPPCKKDENCSMATSFPSGPPNGFMYYDRDKHVFVKATEVEATKQKGNYAISATMKAFNISTATYKKAQNAKQEVQIGLNFTAPISPVGDDLAWILKNAVNIFIGNATDVSGSLASFKTANPTSTASSPTTKVQVLQGAFDLQVNAFFQKKDGFWRKLFQNFAKIPGAPLLATLGIPGVAVSALDFVQYSLQKLTQDEPLLPLWDAQPVRFALTTEAKRDYTFHDGLWCIVDRDILWSTDFLKDYTVDIDGMSYSVVDKNHKGLNANYVVADFDVTST